MQKIKNILFGERSVTKVAALYPTGEAARLAAEHLVENSPLKPAQVRVLGPSDSPATQGKSVGRALEPEQRGIWHTMIKAHIAAGLVGLLIGWALLAIMMIAGVQFITSSPFFSLLTFTFFGLILGLMVGGALTVRPDHEPFIAMVQQGLEDGHWAVIAHPLNADQTHEATRILESGSEKILRSL